MQRLLVRWTTELNWRYLLICTLLFLSASPAFSQSSIGFAKANSVAKEGAVGSSSQLHTIHLTTQAKTTEEVYVSVVATQLGDAEADDYSLITSVVRIPAGTAKGKKFPVTIEIKSDADTLEKNETVILKVTDNGGGDAIAGEGELHLVTIENSTTYSGTYVQPSFKSSEFRIDVGTNFSLLDGVDASGLYANAFVFAPDLGNWKLSKVGRRWLHVGLYASIRQDRSFNDSTTASRPQVFFERLAPTSDLPPDEIRYLRTQADIKEQTRFDNTRLLLSPLVRLVDGRNANLYLALNFEAVRRNFRTTFITTITDTATVALQENGRRPPSRRAPEQIDRVFYDFQYSLSFPMLFSVKAANFSITPTVGRASSELTPNWFAGTRFNVIEPKSGINLGGEIRTFFGKQTSAGNFAPLINIFVSKAFNIAPIGSYQASL